MPSCSVSVVVGNDISDHELPLSCDLKIADSCPALVVVATAIATYTLPDILVAILIFLVFTEIAVSIACVLTLLHVSPVSVDLYIPPLPPYWWGFAKS